MVPRRDMRSTKNMDTHRGRTGTRPKPKKKYEETAIVLDVLPEGKGLRRSDRTPLVQAIGQTWFTLLELIPKENVPIMPLDVVRIGSGVREQIKTVKNRITIDELTNVAQETLELAIEKIVKSQERRFVDFFNKAQPITTRKHSLELLPGVGKTLMWEILEERKKMPFTSFEDIEKRTKVQDAAKLFVKRVLEELKENPRHRLFTREQPSQEGQSSQEGRRR